MTEERREIGYFNYSSQQVIPGYSSLYNALSKTRADTDENNNLKHIENVDGAPREVVLNMGGQFALDRANRGGKRLWQRIYTEEDMEQKMNALGVVTREKDTDASPEQASKEPDAFA